MLVVFSLLYCINYVALYDLYFYFSCVGLCAVIKLREISCERMHYHHYYYYYYYHYHYYVCVCSQLQQVWLPQLTVCAAAFSLWLFCTALPTEHWRWVRWRVRGGGDLYVYQAMHCKIENATLYKWTRDIDKQPCLYWRSKQTTKHMLLTKLVTEGKHFIPIFYLSDSVLLSLTLSSGCFLLLTFESPWYDLRGWLGQR